MQAVDFEYPNDEQPGVSEATEADALRNTLEWFGSPAATRYFGRAFSRRLVALAWTLRPECFDGKSLSALAKSRKISKQALSKYSAQASRIFGIRNGSQRAHGRRWKRQRQRLR